MIPLGKAGSSHCTTTVLELAGLARRFRGALLGAARVNVTHYTHLIRHEDYTSHVTAELYSMLALQSEC